MLLAGCAAPAPEREELPASRADVIRALYRQLDMVLEQHAALEERDDVPTRAERQELMLLAAEIAVRILRIDPNANLGRLEELTR